MRLPVIASGQDIGKNTYSAFSGGFDASDKMFGSKREATNQGPFNGKSVGGALTLGGLGGVGALAGAGIGSMVDGGSALAGAGIGAAVGVAALPTLGFATGLAAKGNSALFKNNKILGAASTIGLGMMGASAGEPLGPMGMVAGAGIAAGVGNAVLGGGSAIVNSTKLGSLMKKLPTKGKIGLGVGVGTAAITGLDQLGKKFNIGASSAWTPENYAYGAAGIGAAALSVPAAILAAGAGTQILGGMINKSVKPTMKGEKKGLIDTKLSGAGKMLLAGAAVIEGVRGASSAFINSRMGEVTGEVVTATPKQPSFEKMNAGASGDLVFALDRLKRG